jgi:hypothetical protein
MPSSTDSPLPSPGTADRIGELIPLRRRRRLVPRHEFMAMLRHAPAVDLEAFRAGQDAALDHEAGSPYER